MHEEVIYALYYTKGSTRSQTHLYCCFPSFSNSEVFDCVSEVKTAQQLMLNAHKCQHAKSFLTHSGPSSAFEKWSGHVEPEGSRMGVFRDLHEKKIGFTVFRSDFIAC